MRRCVDLGQSKSCIIDRAIEVPFISVEEVDDAVTMLVMSTPSMLPILSTSCRKRQPALIFLP